MRDFSALNCYKKLLNGYGEVGMVGRLDPDLAGEMWTRPNPELCDLSAIWRYALTVGGTG